MAKSLQLKSRGTSWTGYRSTAGPQTPFLSPFRLVFISNQTSMPLDCVRKPKYPESGSVVTMVSDMPRLITVSFKKALNVVVFFKIRPYWIKTEDNMDIIRNLIMLRDKISDEVILWPGKGPHEWCQLDSGWGTEDVHIPTVERPSVDNHSYSLHVLSHFNSSLCACIPLHQHILMLV